MSDRESSSRSDDDDSSSYESSSEEEPMLKPVFLNKKQRQGPRPASDGDDKRDGSTRDGDKSQKKESILKQADRPEEVETRFENYDGVDDMDDLDVEGELRAWEERERSRVERDRRRLEEEENAKDEAMRLQSLSEREREEAFLRRSEQQRMNGHGSQPGEPGSSSAPGKHHKAAFYQDDGEMSRFLKRVHSGTEDDGDHSRPRKYKIK
ncbi:Piso0_001535 [Millerozyma farinosa CBS 7064]|uniref:Piso0_001535 protein n=1 Tax=Pichia sorbitophila (strain ATCC MYA-4447 / BCRC 22081 / CBS 7064 / NBRC 10061 / NRRL Y-12695) TaxID=559304 RepID=G8YL22_PICSO|nr:Piso0_001535 [Millerozyma farinosa CBS 7064]